MLLRRKRCIAASALHLSGEKKVGRGMASTKFGDNSVALERLVVSAYTVPTDSPEADGTYSWDKTTMVLVEAYAGATCGIGYTYADAATGKVIQELLEKVVVGRNVMNVSGCWLAMVQAIRNLGRPGIASMAIAAVDSALWDLKARLLIFPLSCCLELCASQLRSMAVAALRLIHESSCRGNLVAGLSRVFRA